MQPQTHTDKNHSRKRNISSHNWLVNIAFIRYQGAMASSMPRVKAAITEFYTDNTNFVTQIENK